MFVPNQVKFTHSICLSVTAGVGLFNGYCSIYRQRLSRSDNGARSDRPLLLAYNIRVFFPYCASCFLWRNKKNINTFQLKNALCAAMEFDILVFYSSQWFCKWTVKILTRLHGFDSKALSRLDNNNGQAGPSCSKLTMSLVNDSLKFTSSDMQICWNFLLKKCE